MSLSGQSIGRKIARNTAYNFVGRAWSLIVTLAMTPFIISHIGIERFGILSIVGAIAGYFGILDFGLGTSFVKYIAEYYTKKEYSKINQIVNTGFVFYFIFTVAATVLAYFVMGLLLRILKIPPHLWKEGMFVFWTGIVLFGCSSMMGVFAAVQNGLQRMDISNRLSIGTSLIGVLATILFLEKGYGLYGIMASNILVFLASGAASVLIAFRLVPELRIGPSFVNGKMFRSLFNFGYKMQTAKIGDIVLFQTDRLLIAGFLNIGLVGFYQLGTTIIQQARQIPLLLISAILPAASEIDARSDHGKMMELYLRGSKYLIVSSFPIMLFVAASANVIMMIWMGPGYVNSAVIIQILSIGYLVNLMAGMGVTVAMAMEELDYQMKAALITMALNIALSVILVMVMGFWGVALATTIALISGPVYFFIKLHSKMGLSQRSFLGKTVLLPFLGSMVPAAIIFAANLIFFKDAGYNGGIRGWAVLMIEFAVFAGVYAAIILKGKYFDGKDAEIFREHLSFRIFR